MSKLSLENSADQAVHILKVEMVKQKIKVPGLVKLLEKEGFIISPEHLRNKFSKCNFKADLFLLILKVLHIKNIDIS